MIVTVRAAQAEARAEALAAAREARAEAMEAAREASAAAREQAAVARVAQREAMKARPIMLTKACAQNVPVMVTERGDRQTIIRCTNFQPIDKAELRRTIISSLEIARQSMAVSMNDDTVRRAREEALAGIDREIARLRSEP